MYLNNGPITIWIGTICGRIVQLPTFHKATSPMRESPEAGQRPRRASRAVLHQAVSYVLQSYPCFEAPQLTPRAQGQLLAGHLIIVSIEGGCFYVRVVVQFDGVVRQARKDEVIPVELQRRPPRQSVREK